MHSLHLSVVILTCYNTAYTLPMAIAKNNAANLRRDWCCVLTLKSCQHAFNICSRYYKFTCCILTATHYCVTEWTWCPSGWHCSRWLVFCSRLYVLRIHYSNAQQRAGIKYSHRKCFLQLGPLSTHGMYAKQKQ